MDIQNAFVIATSTIHITPNDSFTENTVRLASKPKAEILADVSAWLDEVQSHAQGDVADYAVLASVDT